MPLIKRKIIERNIIANFVGRGWTALMALLFIPIYIKFLGMEAFGLVGFFVTLQTLFLVLVTGLSTTVTRELARLSTQPGTDQKKRDLVRTLEVVYWALAIAMAFIVISLSPIISNDWIMTQHLPVSSVQQAVMMMGLVIAFDLPLSLYYGGLIGLQKQVLYNGVDVVSATFRGIGAVAVLWIVSPTVQAFFEWQIVISIAQTFLAALVLWRNLPLTGSPARPQKSYFNEIWRFTAGVTGISILGGVVLQMDKVILSKMLALESFGFYVLASGVASVVLLAATPFFTAIFPRLSQLVVDDDKTGLKNLYHDSCQSVSVIILPMAVIIALFAPEILQMWTGNPVIASETHVIASVLVVGAALNALMYMPYALQLANDWTKLALYQNLVSIIVLVPGIILLTQRYGGVGAAMVLVLLYSGYVFITVQLMHRRLLRGEQRQWYLVDVGLPFIGAFSIPCLGRLWFPQYTSNLIVLADLFIISLMTFAITALMTPHPRSWIIHNFKSLKRAFIDNLRAD